jgi:hypothetical protein
MVSTHYTHDTVGNILGTANAVRLPPNRDLGGPVWQGFRYAKLYRLTVAVGEFEARAGEFDSYNLSMRYDATHNTTHKTQEHLIKSQSSGDTLLNREEEWWTIEYV